MDVNLSLRPDVMRSSDPCRTLDHVPLVTIAIPTFNRASLLKGCVASALSQTYGKFEVLVSDNASTDDTSRILASFDDDRLRIIRQKFNIGLLPNWNACLSEARGEYVVFLSDDDRISPRMLGQCLSVLKTQPATPIVVTLSNVHSKSLGMTYPPRSSKILDTGITAGTEVLAEYLKNNITVSMCSVLLRTDILRANGGFPLQFPHTGDVAAWAPLLLLGSAGFINNACATFAYHNGSETSRLSAEALLEDGWKTASLISGLAHECVDNAATRQLIETQSRRCFAHRGLTILSDFRTSGGEIGKILTLLWRFRQNFAGLSPSSMLRFAAIVLCPRRIADILRKMRPGMPENLA